MVVRRLEFVPGINTSKTNYSRPGGWFYSNSVRFVQGQPEKIGGSSTLITGQGSTAFLGIARSIWDWSNLSGIQYIGVGTNLKYYIARNNRYYDVTPIDSTETLAANPFYSVAGSTLVQVTVADNSSLNVGDYIGFSPASITGNGVTITEFAVSPASNDYDFLYKITEVPAGSTTTFVFDSFDTASSTGTFGGSGVIVSYLLPSASATDTVLSGWGTGLWGLGNWGHTPAGSVENPQLMRLWSQDNFGEDLVFGPRGGELYYWDTSSGMGVRAVKLNTRPGASDVPVIQNLMLVSDSQRFTFCFGTNPVGSTDQDPLLVRWSDQDSATNWTPSAISQAGGIALSNGNRIVAAQQARQEILVWTDTALFSLQYVGVDSGVWGLNIVGENISIMSQNSIAYSNGIAYWMGNGEFFKYDGRTQVLRCDVKNWVFDTLNSINLRNGLNRTQKDQVCCGTNENFGEIWWFFKGLGGVNSSGDPTNYTRYNDRYVVYNYEQDIWYFGTFSTPGSLVDGTRTAWIDSRTSNSPIAATAPNEVSISLRNAAGLSQIGRLVQQEIGNDIVQIVDDNGVSLFSSPVTATQVLPAAIESTMFDLDGGDRFMFVDRILPDISFDESSQSTASATIIVSAHDTAGTGTHPPVGGTNGGISAVVQVNSQGWEFTNSEYSVRMRGRAMTFRIYSDSGNSLGVKWHLGVPRINIRADGRRGKNVVG